MQASDSSNYQVVISFLGQEQQQHKTQRKAPKEVEATRVRNNCCLTSLCEASPFGPKPPICEARRLSLLLEEKRTRVRAVGYFRVYQDELRYPPRLCRLMRLARAASTRKVSLKRPCRPQSTSHRRPFHPAKPSTSTKTVQSSVNVADCSRETRGL
jgi:hypothetical protein